MYLLNVFCKFMKLYSFEFFEIIEYNVYIWRLSYVYMYIGNFMCILMINTLLLIIWISFLFFVIYNKQAYYLWTFKGCLGGWWRWCCTPNWFRLQWGGQSQWRPAKNARDIIMHKCMHITGAFYIPSLLQY